MKISQRKFLHILICTITFLWFGSRIDAEILVIRNANLMTITQGTIHKGIILIQEGRIRDLGSNIEIPPEAKIIEASEYTLMPGLIDAFTNIGTWDILGDKNDNDEATAPITPHLRIIDGINPDNVFICRARETGITSILCAPGEANLLSGQSALISLSGSTVKKMTIKFPVAVHGSLGQLPKLRYAQKDRYPSTRMGEAALLRQTLIDALDHLQKTRDYEKKLKEYDQAKKVNATKSEKPKPLPVNLKHKALFPILDGRMPLILRANRRDDILTALRIAEEFKIKIVLNHGAEAYRVAKTLAEHNIPVILGPVTENFMLQETLAASDENAKILYEAGVKIAFQTGSFKNYASLLAQARKHVSKGLPHQAALEALTINPAIIFGVSENIGSLEKGKKADLIMFRGDPLNDIIQIEMVIIQGKIEYKNKN